LCQTQIHRQRPNANIVESCIGQMPLEGNRGVAILIMRHIVEGPKERYGKKQETRGLRTRWISPNTTSDRIGAPTIRSPCIVYRSVLERTLFPSQKSRFRIPLIDGIPDVESDILGDALLGSRTKLRYGISRTRHLEHASAKSRNSCKAFKILTRTT